jgi:A/G-specific adenine glycosylase
LFGCIEIGKKQTPLLISDFQKLYNNEGLTSDVIKLFQNIIYDYYERNRREFPFRKNLNPYRVLVSEIMLQQTQTSRVSEKYIEFLNKFPDFQALSESSLDDVLKIWQGLGYNRRAIALKKISEIVMKEHRGKLPDSVDILKSFPQIGHNTASSILAFAFNQPSIFIETNIRRIYIYFFFPGKDGIKDTQILPFVEQTMDRRDPREWYYALMDYGVMLKKAHPELNKRSAHYKKQKSFKGSNRQIRGKILKLLIKDKVLLKSEICSKLKLEANKLDKILNQLMKEGFIKKEKKGITLVK